MAPTRESPDTSMEDVSDVNGRVDALNVSFPSSIILILFLIDAPLVYMFPSLGD
jgi:hypothetical protein